MKQFYNNICVSCIYKFKCEGQDETHWRIFPNQCKKYKHFYYIPENPFITVYNNMATKEKIAIMQAFIDGKTIEYKSKNTSSNWHEINSFKHLDCDNLWDFSSYEYRIKPEPKHRPYKSAEEFLKASTEHGPYIHIGNSHHWIPTHVANAQIELNCRVFSYEELMPYTWQDGTPCGIKE